MYRRHGDAKKRRILTGIEYDWSEIAYEDEWEKRGGDPYAGKVYRGGKYTEILTMGLERLYRDPQGFAQQDPDYFDFILGIVRMAKA